MSGLVVFVVLIAWCYVLIRTGSPAADVLRWIGVLLLEVLAPGFVVVRAVRRATAPLVEDVAWATVAGCMVALLGWFVDRVLPVAPGPYLVGPLVIAAGLIVPATRRRVLARPAPGWGVGPSVTLGAVMMVAIGWMASTGLRAYRVDPGVHGTSYYPDVMYQLDLVGELRHMLVPTYPPVDGTSLSYHWFLYAIDAHLVTHSGINVFDSSLRLAPATLVPAILLLAAVVARRLATRVWAGPVAAGLLGVVDISQASRWSTEDTSIGVLSRNWRASPPQTMGWLASLGAAGALFAFLRRSEDDRAVPVALLVPLFVLTAGSKSSELPVITAGVALAAFVQLLRRDWVVLKRCLIALGLGLVVFEAASLTIYGSSSYGVRLQLLGVIRARMSRMFPSIRPGTGSLVHPPHYALVAIGDGHPALDPAAAAAAARFVLPGPLPGRRSGRLGLYGCGGRRVRPVAAHAPSSRQRDLLHAVRLSDRRRRSGQRPRPRRRSLPGRAGLARSRAVGTRLLLGRARRRRGGSCGSHRLRPVRPQPAPARDPRRRLDLADPFGLALAGPHASRFSSCSGC